MLRLPMKFVFKYEACDSERRNVCDVCNVCMYISVYVCIFLFSFKHAPLHCVILHAMVALIYLLFIL